jgi:hypothetical protein
MRGARDETARRRSARQKIGRGVKARVVAKERIHEGHAR